MLINSLCKMHMHIAFVKMKNCIVHNDYWTNLAAKNSYLYMYDDLESYHTYKDKHMPNAF